MSRDTLERGLPRAADTGASGPAKLEETFWRKSCGRSRRSGGATSEGPSVLSPDEASAETSQGVAWSHPSRGITDDLGGPLSKVSLL